MPGGREVKVRFAEAELLHGGLDFLLPSHVLLFYVHVLHLPKELRVFERGANLQFRS